MTAGEGGVSTHSRPKAAGLFVQSCGGGIRVSTHSRPKAAGLARRCGRWKHWFQHTAARRRLAKVGTIFKQSGQFQHTAARRRLVSNFSTFSASSCFNTQPPEGGWAKPKTSAAPSRCFNTQPPEGGWQPICPEWLSHCSFNTQPPEGGWILEVPCYVVVSRVSTHSRPKAAGPVCRQSPMLHTFQHTAARRRLDTTQKSNNCFIGFNTQPPEGGWNQLAAMTCFVESFNTQPPEGGWRCFLSRLLIQSPFQHTAARRRLGGVSVWRLPSVGVSTHSRPKAAGKGMPLNLSKFSVSTHSRPKAAGLSVWFQASCAVKFQHTAARRRLGISGGSLLCSA